MNQKTAKMIKKIAQIFNKRERGIKQLWNTLTPKQKEITRRDFEEIIKKDKINKRELEVKKKKELEDHVEKLEKKIVKNENKSK